ncbi:MAG: GSU2086 family protein [Limisphaerales bacterium]
MIPPPPLDLTRLKVLPLEQRRSLTTLDEVLIEPADDPPPVDDPLKARIEECAARIRSAQARGAGVLLIYGAHLIKNGGQLLLVRLMDHGWVTHLATNGAGTIHDWEYSWLGRSTESVRDNVATGTFGTWDETGRNLHLALLLGGLRGEGYGHALGRYIYQDGGHLPDPVELERLIREHPADPLTPARADLFVTMRRHGIAPGALMTIHSWRNVSPLANAFRHEVPFTVHPGIGYDIITNHPLFNGASLGRAAGIDFARFAGTVETLDGGVVLSIGSAIMGPQVFEKALSCVNNLRLQEGRPVVGGHHLYVVDLQDGGNWDWTQGEPPRDNPAYYLRFCKSYSRMGGTMHYLQCDNTAFLHHLFHALRKPGD